MTTVQAILAIIGALTTLLTAAGGVVRAMGAKDSPVGGVLLRLGADVVGATQAATGKLPARDAGPNSVPPEANK